MHLSCTPGLSEGGVCVCVCDTVLYFKQNLLVSM